MTRPVVIVDGTNVARSLEWAGVLAQRGIDADEDVARAADALVDLAASWAAREGVRLEIVFDGHGAERTVGEHVVVIRAGDADPEVAARAVRALMAGAEVRVVSDDHDLRQASGVAPATGVAAWVAELVGAPVEPAPEPPPLPGSAGASRVLDGLDDELRARLEQLRRGEP